MELKMVIPAIVAMIQIDWFQLYPKSVQWSAPVTLTKLVEVLIE